MPAGSLWCWAPAYELAFNEISGSDIYSIVQPELFALSAELKKTTAFYLFSGDSYSMLSINPYPGTPYPNVTIGQSIDVRSGQYGPVCLSAFEYEKICEITRTMSGDDAKRAPCPGRANPVNGDMICSPATVPTNCIVWRFLFKSPACLLWLLPCTCSIPTLQAMGSAAWCNACRRFLPESAIRRRFFRNRFLPHSFILI